MKPASRRARAAEPLTFDLPVSDMQITGKNYNFWTPEENKMILQ